MGNTENVKKTMAVTYKCVVLSVRALNHYFHTETGIALDLFLNFEKKNCVLLKLFKKNNNYQLFGSNVCDQTKRLSIENSWPKL